MINLTASAGTSYVSSQAESLHVDTNHLCQVKGPSGYQIVSCIVNLSSTGTSYKLSIGGFDAGDAVVELLSCTTSTADDTGNVTMYMSKGEPKAYILQSNLNATGLCNTTEDAATAAKSSAGLARSVTNGVSLFVGVAVATIMVVM